MADFNALRQEIAQLKKEKNALLAKRSLDIIDAIAKKLQGEDEK